MARWRPAEPEIEVKFPADEERIYRHPRLARRSVFARVAWPDHMWVGRNRGGCFAEVVARAHFEALGYKVLLSAPEYPRSQGYLLLSYRQKRLAGHRAFRRMERQFPGIDLDALAEEARALKLKRCTSGGGGDPDLFVYRPHTTDRFFVEVKFRDELICNQLVCFPLLERDLCPVKVVRLVPE